MLKIDNNQKGNSIRKMALSTYFNFMLKAYELSMQKFLPIGLQFMHAGTKWPVICPTKKALSISF